MVKLEKYKTKSSRYTCPACGQPRVFSRYVDESGEYFADDVGRCNRESKCSYHYTPKEYFRDHHPSQDCMPKPKLPAKPQIAVIKFDEIPQKYLDASLTGTQHNAFVKFLLRHFDSQAVNDSVKRYALGINGNRTAFWQIDRQGRIHTAKLIAYDVATGKRIKTQTPSWMHAELKRSGILSDSFALRQCFFGEHLLAASHTSIIAVVEAEKTAVIASLALPEYVWLACGGKTQLSVEKLARLRNQQIILFPDSDGYRQWFELASEARTKGLDIKVSDLLESTLTEAEKAEGIDLADYLLRENLPIDSELSAVSEAAKTNVLSASAIAQRDAEYSERAAVLEFDAGLSREEAEAKAIIEFANWERIHCLLCGADVEAGQGCARCAQEAKGKTQFQSGGNKNL